jgi:hypothetical protein
LECWLVPLSESLECPRETNKKGTMFSLYNTTMKTKCNGETVVYQHQHIAYAQNYNCGAQQLQFTLLVIAIM